MTHSYIRVSHLQTVFYCIIVHWNGSKAEVATILLALDLTQPNTKATYKINDHNQIKHYIEAVLENKGEGSLS